MHAPYLEKAKKIWIYLPENYDSGENFPVIYMQNGQDMFYDNLAKSRVSWRVAETMDELYYSENISAIVVATENDNPNEFSPWLTQKKNFFKAETEKINFGQEYADFLAKILKPYIDRNFKTDERALATAIIGSNTGAMESVYTGLKYNYIFGNICVFSINASLHKKKFEKFVSEIELGTSPSFYIYCGGMESNLKDKNEDFLKTSTHLAQIMLKRGAKVRITHDSMGLNHESRWGQEFYGFIKYFYSLLKKT